MTPTTTPGSWLQAVPCASCGEPLEGVASFCTRCGSRVHQAEEATRSRTAAATCDGCGAAVSFPEGLLTTTCPFCGSSAVRQGAVAEARTPAFALGFARGEEEARATFRSWLRGGGWFVPGDLRRAAQLDELRGIYLPCWCCSALAESRYHVEIGEYWYRTETYQVQVGDRTETRTRQVRETEWYPFSGQYHAWQPGYLVSASQGLPQDEFAEIKPFATELMRRYHPGLVAGWVAEMPTLTEAEARTVTGGYFRAQQEVAVATHLPGDTHRHLRLETQLSRFDTDLVLVPIWLAVYRYRDQAYRFVLNGQTGVHHGRRPVSTLRVVAAVALGIAVVAGLLLALAGLG